MCCNSADCADFPLNEFVEILKHLGWITFPFSQYQFRKICGRSTHGNFLDTVTLIKSSRILADFADSYATLKISSDMKFCVSITWRQFPLSNRSNWLSNEICTKSADSADFQMIFKRFTIILKSNNHLKSLRGDLWHFDP